MPSAHMAPDSTLALGVGFIEKTQRYTLDFQALPWLETDFRYSHYEPGSQAYDRSFGFKMRLLDETTNFADVSVGVRDLIGTGIYSSEYVAASKHVGPVDITLGMGWGRLADRAALNNPVGEILHSWLTRGAQSAPGTGGALNFKEFFSGPKVGLFGGATWDTPIQGLRLMAEYSSDEYTRERSSSPRTFAVRSPFNLGFSYQLSDGIQIGAGWYYGSSYGLTLSAGSSMKGLAQSNRIGAPPPEIAVRSDDQQLLAVDIMRSRSGRISYGVLDVRQATFRQLLQSEGSGIRDLDLHGSVLTINAQTMNDVQGQCIKYARIVGTAAGAPATIALTDLNSPSGAVTLCPVVARRAGSIPTEQEKKVRAGLNEQGLILEAYATNGSEAWIYYSNDRYNQESEAIDRALRVLTRDADPSIEVFHLFPLMADRPTQEITVPRGSLERMARNYGASEELSNFILTEPAPLSNPLLAATTRRTFPRFDWDISPRLGQQLFDPNKPIGIEIFADFSADVVLRPGLTIGAGISSTVWTDVDFKRGSDSLLPHVRSDVLKYLDDGRNGISYLAVDYVTRLAPDVFMDAKVGYLEDMYAGAGVQFLWRPQGSRLSFGADIYQVWQRDFDRLFGVQSYNVLTGHISAYWDTPWYDLVFAVHGGRYLAKDYGITAEVKRRFKNGVEVGAFATVTNVPFQTFGEGSFDKGITIFIPLQTVAPISTQIAYNLQLHPLTRDGGQRLTNDDSLYALTNRTSFREIVEHLDEVASP